MEQNKKDLFDEFINSDQSMSYFCYEKGESIQDFQKRFNEYRVKKEDEVLPKFEMELPKGYKLVRNYVFNSDHPSATVMTREGYPLCIIELVLFNLENAKADEKVKLENAKADINEKVKLAGAQFAVITDGKTYYLCDESNSEEKDPKESIEEIIEAIIQQGEKEPILDYFRYNLGFVITSEIKLEGNICYLDSKNEENNFINSLFHFEDYDGTVYRYIPLESLFKTLQYGTIRMSGLPGMNDVSEVDYVEKFLYGKSSNSDKINKIFIMSFSIDRDDDLTQWRLYADDAKGARLKFNNFNKKDDAFTFRKIKYIDTDSEPLKKLKGLVEYVKRVTGYTFVFKTLHEWCHFIKPKDYAVESEVRLLYNSSESFKTLHHSDNWLFAHGTSIANPFIELSLSNHKGDKEVFPLKLVDIKLGPKCPERETNKSQLKVLIEENPKLHDIQVSESDIKHYR